MFLHLFADGDVVDEDVARIEEAFVAEEEVPHIRPINDGQHALLSDYESHRWFVLK